MTILRVSWAYAWILLVTTTEAFTVPSGIAPSSTTRASSPKIGTSHSRSFPETTTGNHVAMSSVSDDTKQSHNHRSGQNVWLSLLEFAVEQTFQAAGHLLEFIDHALLEQDHDRHHLTNIDDESATLTEQPFFFCSKVEEPSQPETILPKLTSLSKDIPANNVHKDHDRNHLFFASVEPVAERCVALADQDNGGSTVPTVVIPNHSSNDHPENKETMWMEFRKLEELTDEFQASIHTPWSPRTMSERTTTVLRASSSADSTTTPEAADFVPEEEEQDNMEPQDPMEDLSLSSTTSPTWGAPVGSEITSMNGGEDSYSDFSPLKPSMKMPMYDTLDLAPTSSPAIIPMKPKFLPPKPEKPVPVDGSLPLKPSGKTYNRDNVDSGKVPASAPAYFWPPMKPKLAQDETVPREPTLAEGESKPLNPSGKTTQYNTLDLAPTSAPAIKPWMKKSPAATASQVPPVEESSNQSRLLKPSGKAPVREEQERGPAFAPAIKPWMKKIPASIAAEESSLTNMDDARGSRPLKPSGKTYNRDNEDSGRITGSTTGYFWPPMKAKSSVDLEDMPAPEVTDESTRLKPSGKMPQYNTQDLAPTSAPAIKPKMVKTNMNALAEATPIVSDESGSRPLIPSGKTYNRENEENGRITGSTTGYFWPPMKAKSALPQIPSNTDESSGSASKYLDPTEKSPMYDTQNLAPTSAPAILPPMRKPSVTSVSSPLTGKGESSTSLNAVASSDSVTDMEAQESTSKPLKPIEKSPMYETRNLAPTSAPAIQPRMTKKSPRVISELKPVATYNEYTSKSLEPSGKTTRNANQRLGYVPSSAPAIMAPMKWNRPALQEEGSTTSTVSFEGSKSLKPMVKEDLYENVRAGIIPSSAPAIMPPMKWNRPIQEDNPQSGSSISEGSISLKPMVKEDLHESARAGYFSSSAPAIMPTMKKPQGAGTPLPSVEEDYALTSRPLMPMVKEDLHESQRSGLVPSSAPAYFWPPMKLKTGSPDTIEDATLAAAASMESEQLASKPLMPMIKEDLYENQRAGIIPSSAPAIMPPMRKPRSPTALNSARSSDSETENTSSGIDSQNAASLDTPSAAPTSPIPSMITRNTIGAQNNPTNTPFFAEKDSLGKDFTREHLAPTSSPGVLPPIGRPAKENKVLEKQQVPEPSDNKGELAVPTKEDAMWKVPQQPTLVNKLGMGKPLSPGLDRQQSFATTIPRKNSPKGPVAPGAEKSDVIYTTISGKNFARGVPEDELDRRESLRAVRTIPRTFSQKPIGSRGRKEEFEPIQEKIKQSLEDPLKSSSSPPSSATAEKESHTPTVEEDREEVSASSDESESVPERPTPSLPSNGVSVALHHTAIRTRDIEAAMSFYSLLGFQETCKFRAGPAKACWLSLPEGGARLELIEVPRHLWREPNGRPRAPDLMSQSTVLGLNHVALDVTLQIQSAGMLSLGEWLTALVEKSWEEFEKVPRVALEPEERIIGQSVFEVAFIYDADGSLVELLHEKSQLKQPMSSGWEPLR